MDIKHYRRVNILDKEVLIKGLNRDKRYAFNIVHYVNFTDELRQVEDSYRKVEATTHEVGMYGYVLRVCHSQEFQVV